MPQFTASPRAIRVLAQGIAFLAHVGRDVTLDWRENEVRRASRWECRIV
jgi:hypothetical protein